MWIDRLKNIDASGGQNIAELLREIYSAVSTHSYRLATIGIRALLEHVMVHKVSDQGSFAKNLDTMHESGVLSLSQRDSLSAILEAGHATMHRFFEPKQDEVETMLDIIETVLASLYIHPDRANRIADRVPPRRRQ
jgi:hypothetical protein